MNINLIIDNIIEESGQIDLSSKKNIVLGWLNRYKLELQVEKRYFISEKEDDLEITQNNRTTLLPNDFLIPIQIRRPMAFLQGITQDVFGNQFTVTKKVVLKRYLDREQFQNDFPIANDSGTITGVPNNYIFQGTNIVWGPVPKESETVKIDYFGILPPYDNNITDDILTELFYNGLFYRGMYEIFDSWIPDDKKADRWMKRVIKAEAGLKKLEINRSHPMESTFNLVDN